MRPLRLVRVTALEPKRQSQRQPVSAAAWVSLWGFVTLSVMAVSIHAAYWMGYRARRDGEMGRAALAFLLADSALGLAARVTQQADSLRIELQAMRRPAKPPVYVGPPRLPPPAPPR